MEMVVPSATSLIMPSTVLLTQPENDSKSFWVLIMNYIIPANDLPLFISGNLETNKRNYPPGML